MRTMFLALACLTVSPAWAINKCTMPDGAVVFQDAPCGVEAKKSEGLKTWGGNTTASKPASAFRVEPDLALQTHASAAPLMAFYRRWSDGEKLVLATARIALAQPVASLQSLQREVEAYVPPSCLAQPKGDLVTLIAKNVSVMLNFMGKDDLSGMVYQFVDRAKMIRAFEASLKASKCD